MLPNIPQSKSNQAMKFALKIYFKNQTDNELGRLVSDLSLFFRKVLYEVKASGMQLSFDIFWQPSTWHTIKTNHLKL